jgi:polyisoprenoid-binding protein YceI
MRFYQHLRLPLLALLFVPLFALPAQAEIQTYKIDNNHSFANWEIRHVVSHTSGTFHDVQGKLVLNTEDVAKSSVEATISVYSLNSSNIKRDVHLLTDEFLGARDYPEMKFVSTKVAPVTPEKGTVTGNLTLHGVTKPVTLDYEILGLGKDPWGGMRIGFKATTQIKRSDYGINKYIPYGPVGNEVDITLLIEGIRLDADGQPWNVQKAMEQNSKVISFPVPAEAAPQPMPVPEPVTIPATAPATSPAPVTAAQPAATTQSPPSTQPAAEAAPEKQENVKEQLKKELLKGLFN